MSRALAPRKQRAMLFLGLTGSLALAVGVAYAWTIQPKTPLIRITFPRTGRVYGRRAWRAGCARRQPEICGTATDPVGLASVQVSIRQNATGRYWNGRRWAARKPAYLGARIAPVNRPGRSATTRKWFYAIGTQWPDGSYTLHVRAKDRHGNTLRRNVPKSVFTIDTRPPSVVITSYPSNPSTSPTAQFTFHANEPRVSFRCGLDGRPFATCASPIGYGDLSLASHTFDVVAIDAAGNASSSRYSWQVVSLLPLNLSGDVTTSAGMLYPGLAPRDIPVTLSNPNGVTIYVTDIKANLKSTGAPGCNARWFTVTQASLPQSGIAVPPHGTVTLPAQGATAPTVRMIESGTNQDSCQGARLTLGYDGSAHG